jgi:hypothetical protein
MYSFNRKGIIKYSLITLTFLAIIYGVFGILFKIWFPTGMLF